MEGVHLPDAERQHERDRLRQVAHCQLGAALSERERDERRRDGQRLGGGGGARAVRVERGDVEQQPDLRGCACVGAHAYVCACARKCVGVCVRARV